MAGEAVHDRCESAPLPMDELFFNRMGSGEALAGGQRLRAAARLAPLSAQLQSCARLISGNTHVEQLIRLFCIPGGQLQRFLTLRAHRRCSERCVPQQRRGHGAAGATCRRARVARAARQDARATTTTTAPRSGAQVHVDASMGGITAGHRRWTPPTSTTCVAPRLGLSCVSCSTVARLTTTPPPVFRPGTARHAACWRWPLVHAQP